MIRRTIELKPVRESTADYEKIESRIKSAFKRLLYLPLLRELGIGRAVIANAQDDLIAALESGRITASKGVFRGAFDAATSRELRLLGAIWDKRTSTFRIATANIPPEIRQAISTATERFRERLARIDKRLKKMPEEIAGQIATSDLFALAIRKTDRQIAETLKKITIPPKLTDREREKIAAEWGSNMDLWIKDFTEEEITRLRKDVAKSIFAGDRYESLVGSIERSYGVTANKAKFLARQETGLLMAKFKETRYTGAGINEYKWRTVAGSPNHPVRPSHKILDGKVFRWDQPPVTTAPDQPVRRNNPGQDYNCRCTAVPIVRFKK